MKTTDWGAPETLEQWRANWAKAVNDALEKKGITERIDHRSNAERGLHALPTVHEGPAVCAMEKRGIRTEKYEKRGTKLMRKAYKVFMRECAKRNKTRILIEIVITS